MGYNLPLSFFGRSHGYKRIKWPCALLNHLRLSSGELFIFFFGKSFLCINEWMYICSWSECVKNIYIYIYIYIYRERERGREREGRERVREGICWILSNKIYLISDVLHWCKLFLRGDCKPYPHNVNFRNIFLRN